MDKPHIKYSMKYKEWCTYRCKPVMPWMLSVTAGRTPKQAYDRFCDYTGWRKYG